MTSCKTPLIITQGKPITCKAAVCRKAGEGLVIEEIEVDPPKFGEVRIKVICSSLCHTDITFWNMKTGPFAVVPRIFGHEAVGIVESVGEGVDEVREGDTVLPVFQTNCKECKDCKSSRSNRCQAFVGKGKATADMPRDGTSRFRDVKGEILHHFIGVSCFSQYTVVDIINIVKINPHMPPDKACLFSCAIPTGIGAVWKVANVEEGSTVAIFGLGTVGLAVREKISGKDLVPFP